MSPEQTSVRIVEVGPRDGLQNVAAFVPTSTKLELITRLRDAGLRSIELTSLVSPKAIPQLADCQTILSDENIRAWQNQQDVRFPVLVPNLKGFDIAVKNRVQEIAVFVSATEEFSKANTNCSVDEGLRRAEEVTKRATSAGMRVRGYISCIFADPYSGPTCLSAVLRCVERLLQIGCYEISLGDTVGIGTAVDVRRLITYLVENGISINVLAGHFHDTYGQAVVNVWQAYQCGVRVFDSSVAGLGGCPFAPGAKGNIATEDLVYLFNRMGVHTGIDLTKLANTGAWISGQLSKANDSRAGAALVAKVSQTITKDTQLPTRLVWSPERTGEEVEVYRSGTNLKLVLNRRKYGNTLTTSMITTLIGIFEQSRTDESVSRIIITGSGRFFCTGMDLGKDSSPVARDNAASRAQLHRLTKLFELIDNAPQVTIASINGPAFGGGIGLAFVCDIRFAVKTASLTLSEVRLGLCAATISKYVIREWGPAFAREAMLSARKIEVAELRSLGAIAHLAADSQQLDIDVDHYIASLATAAPKASAMSKELVRLDFTDRGSAKQAKGIESIFVEMMEPGGEAAWGLKQFQMGNRTPNWDLHRSQMTKAKL